MAPTLPHHRELGFRCSWALHNALFLAVSDMPLLRAFAAGKPVCRASAFPCVRTTTPKSHPAVRARTQPLPSVIEHLFRVSTAFTARRSVHCVKSYGQGFKVTQFDEKNGPLRNIVSRAVAKLRTRPAQCRNVSEPRQTVRASQCA